MHVIDVKNFIANEWVAPDDSARPIENAITGEIMARAGNASLDMEKMRDYAKNIGGTALRKMTFHDRARMLKALASHLNEHKQSLYEISFSTGSTQSDHLIDIDGGIGTLFVFASKGRREMPDARIYLDGELEHLSRKGHFLGQHIYAPLQGVAVHINAFNFPVWGMLEKLAPTLLAGVPAIVKPATATSYVTELAVKIMLDSGILPDGALQLVSGGVGNLLDILDCQDVVSFTGSASTALQLRSHPNILGHSIRFVAEQDSLNASILGADARPDSDEFALFMDEVQREMTTKAGQKCTAIRRIIVPQAHEDIVLETLKARFEGILIGDPRDATTQMGALVSQAQIEDVLEKARVLNEETQLISGQIARLDFAAKATKHGAFLSPILFHCPDPDTAKHIHNTEAFGPVATVMGYRDLDHAIQLANKAEGALVTSIFTRDAAVAEQIIMGASAYHGRLYFNNRDCMGEATGHGAPLPHMIHGGPGRAGGGEELGGVRGVKHYMQRTAIQASPNILTAIGKKWVPGSREIKHPEHPFRRNFDALEIGETIITKPRKITLEDIEHFAHFTGDLFYAHMDAAAAARNVFFGGRVAHGYLLLSFAAGLFVDPDEGPVLANTGLDHLRFLQPIEAGEAIYVRLTVKQKTPRNDDYGEVRWHVTILNQDDAAVAEYELLTMNAYA